jgi:hypothetical protein
VKCAIAHCPNELRPRARLAECQACRNVFRYWYKRPAKALIARQEALTKWQERMLRLAEQPKGAKHAKAIKRVIHTQGAHP